MATSRCRFGVRILALLVGCISMAMAALPARGQFFAPPASRFSSDFVEPVGFETTAYETDSLAAEAEATEQESHCHHGLGCRQSLCCEPEYGWYISLSGAAQSRDQVQEVGDPATFLTFDDGFAINAAIGRQFDLFRLDFEYSYLNNQIETAGAGIPNVGNFVGDAVGNVSVKAYTLNAYYDHRICQTRFKPYFGSGIGLMQSEINSLFPSFFPALGAGTTAVNTTSNVKFCYQFRVGMNYELTQRTEFFSGYRFFDAGPLTFAGEPFGVFSPDAATFHNFEAGFRVKF